MRILPRSRRGRFALVAVVLIAVAIAFAPTAFERAFEWRYHRSPPAPSGPPPRDAAEATRRDLDYIAQLPDYDRSFSADARAAFVRRLNELRARSDTLLPAELVMGVSELAAFADNAHTNASFGGRGRLLNSVPLRFAFLADGWYVVRAAPAQAGLLGARVLAIDGVAVETWHRHCARYIGGPETFVRAWAPVLLQSPQALHVMRNELPDDRLTLKAALPDGRIVEAQIAAEAPNPKAVVAAPGRYLSPERVANEPADWRTLLARDGEPPVSLRDAGRSIYTTALRDGSVLYVHLWQIFDDERGALSDSIVAALAGNGGKPWPAIVLDLRFDTGGDYETAYRGIRALVDRLAPEGRLLILTDQSTFSAALVVAAWAKHYGGARAAIVGERLGDRSTFWAEGVPFVLPEAKLRVSIATGYHDWENGCRDIVRCFWLNFRYDVPAGSLAPTIAVGWRADDYRRGVDTVLERALAAISAPAPASK